MIKSRKPVALFIIVVIVISAVVAVYFTRLQVAPQISLAASTFVAVQGTQIAFTVYGLEPNGIATVYFGDGSEANTSSTATYTYPNPGRYLVAAQEYVNGQPVSSTFGTLQTIQVTPQIGSGLAPLISVPTVAFDVSRNPSAPVVHAGDSVALYGGFLEPPSGTNITISQYVWDFGNGASQTVAANSTSLKPTENPATTMYSQPGLYPVQLSLVTANTTSMATYRTLVEQTIAVASGSEPFAVFLYGGSVPNPSVISVAEWLPGGPLSFDPYVGTDPVSFEIVLNVFSALIAWNGSSVTNFIPMAAADIPSVANGEISPDYTAYTFHLRSGLKFSNGDPITAYDVWYSTIRGILFIGGLPNTGVPTSALSMPIMANATDTVTYNAIMNSVTYSNSSNTVTFKFLTPIAQNLFFDTLTLGAYSFPLILDAKWLEQVGAGITFTPAGFYAYQKQATTGHYNLKVQYDPLASGPYMIQSYAPGQSITLVPNPDYPGVPGIPAVNNTVVIQWVKDGDTAYNLFKSGQVDIVGSLLGNRIGFAGGADYVPRINQLVANGQAVVYQFPSITGDFFSLNLAINETALKTNFGTQYHIPSDYFTNLKVRKAFAFAFNYTNYIDVIQGNTKTGIDFGDGYAGAIAPGVFGYVPTRQLWNVPTYNLTYAKQLLQESGEYNTSINIPVMMDPADYTNFAGVQMWASALHSIDSNIVMTPIYAPDWQTFGVWYLSNLSGIPIRICWNYLGPYASFGIDPAYSENGWFAPLHGWSVSYLNSTGHPDQAVMYARLNSLITEADSTTNSTLAAQDYKQVEQIAIDLYMYVYTVILNSFWVVKPYMTGYRGQISYQMNPVIGGYGDGQYYWWVKGCETPQACSGRNIGP